MTNDRSAQDLRALLAAIESAGWDYARIELDDLTIVVSDGRTELEPTVSTSAVAPTPAAGPAATHPREEHIPEEESVPEFARTDAAVTPNDEMHGDVETVISPTIGLFWRSPKPGAPPFVEPGQHVEADATVCIIEVMKLMTHVKAGHTGTVVRIHATNGDTVEFGTPLLDISPA
jgi:acetyl-CoA carboxylase biotin carboxyl carrier protein